MIVEILGNHIDLDKVTAICNIVYESGFSKRNYFFTVMFDESSLRVYGEWHSIESDRESLVGKWVTFKSDKVPHL